MCGRSPWIEAIEDERSELGDSIVVEDSLSRVIGGEAEEAYIVGGLGHIAESWNRHDYRVVGWGAGEVKKERLMRGKLGRARLEGEER